MAILDVFLKTIAEMEPKPRNNVVVSFVSIEQEFSIAHVNLINKPFFGNPFIS